MRRLLAALRPGSLPGANAVWSGGTRLAGAVSSRAGRVAWLFREPPRAPVPYEAEDRGLKAALWRNALMGFFGSSAILLGASLPSSPFTEKFSAWPAWFFGLRPGAVLLHVTPRPGQGFYLSLVAFYGGMVLLMRAWIRLMRLAREHPGLPLRAYAWVMVLWVLPMLFVAPMLSKDAYSYVAQGEMMSRHINPYQYDPCILGCKVNSYTYLTDPLWWHVTSPYGPLFLGLAGAIQVAVNHSELWALVLWRFVALGGVALLALFVPRLAQRFGRDAALAFSFAVMNPIVLVHLVGGEHNDALMLGLLVAGLALAYERHPVAGTVLVALAVMVKVPAALGLLYIGWEWYGSEVDWRRRLRGLVRAGVLGLGVMEAVTAVVGIGWGWVGGLTNPDTVRSYMDPMTAIGLGLGKLVGAVGLGEHSHLLLTLARGSGALAAAFLGLWLLRRSKGGASSLRAIALTMLAVVVLGPVMQPWYLAWGVVLIGAVMTERVRLLLVWLTVVVTFLGLGDAQYFFTELGKSNPVIVAVASAGLAALVLAPPARRALRPGGRWSLSRVAEGKPATERVSVAGDAGRGEAPVADEVAAGL